MRKYHLPILGMFISCSILISCSSTPEFIIDNIPYLVQVGNVYQEGDSIQNNYEVKGRIFTIGGLFLYYNRRVVAMEESITLCKKISPNKKVIHCNIDKQEITEEDDISNLIGKLFDRKFEPKINTTVSPMSSSGLIYEEKNGLWTTKATQRIKNHKKVNEKWIKTVDVTPKNELTETEKIILDSRFVLDSMLMNLNLPLMKYGDTITLPSFYKKQIENALYFQVSDQLHVKYDVNDVLFAFSDTMSIDGKTHANFELSIKVGQELLSDEAKELYEKAKNHPFSVANSVGTRASILTIKVKLQYCIQDRLIRKIHATIDTPSFSLLGAYVFLDLDILATYTALN